MQRRRCGAVFSLAGGLLQQLTKRLLGSAPEGETSDHLGDDKHDPAGKNGGNSRNGTRAETVLTDVGPVEMSVPRDRDGSFGPEIVKKRQKRLTGVDEMVISLSAKGLTAGEVRAHLAEVYGAARRSPRSPTRSSRAWLNGRTAPLDPVVFINAIHVKIRDGGGGRALDAHPHRDQEPRCGRRPDARLRRSQGPARRGRTIYPQTIVRTYVIHLLRNSFRHAARQDWDKIAKVFKPACTAATEEAALERFAEFADAWGRKYPAIVKLWENAWEEFTPLLRFDTEIRRIVCTTNAIESVNARIRRAVKALGRFPNEQAALKCVYMAIMSLDPTGKGQTRWTLRWKMALNAFDGRPSAARQ
ncbi:transposase [Streptomyces niveiscabiei]|uniref:transposase n=1 Tax=Streptomyces niveiscabiei TaxID=164115 RepID=UPI003EB7FDF6